ncbi:ESX secretion-associated protein EspG [Mycobacteroides chelonae]|uniref:ESX secretion-associated protein EspG n=1 Tax=Mycobacteroides chelonae TaxID=1774 RepID=UPI0008A91C33|nr:ESX secretion-associated protein EspG [Mycobacteroides chelonae]OHT77317.1 ESX secretion-associated protein EspG [Mycobacteroides chelonae]
MTSALASSYTLTDDELQVIANRIGVQSLPVVLAIRPRHATYTALDTAFDAATARLSERGLIVDGQVSPELIATVRLLQRPDRDLSMRLVTPDGISRVSVVRNGQRMALVRRIENEILLREISGHAEAPEAIQTLLAELPGAEAAQVDPVGAPLDAVRDALFGTHDPAILADRVRALGADTRAAMTLGAALATRMAFAEVVYHAIDTSEDRIERTRAAVGVFYTKRGRLVSAPSLAPSGQIWATIKGASNHTITQAIRQLIELLPCGWKGNQ